MKIDRGGRRHGWEGDARPGSWLIGWGPIAVADKEESMMMKSTLPKVSGCIQYTMFVWEEKLG
jgi:hypothetical protein